MTKEEQVMKLLENFMNINNGNRINQFLTEILLTKTYRILFPEPKKDTTKDEAKKT